jgi:hypothetical protein
MPKRRRRRPPGEEQCRPHRFCCHLKIGALVDVIGICKETSDMQTFTSRSTKRELKKREVLLVDQSKTAVMTPHNCPPVDKVDCSHHFDSGGFPSGLVRRDRRHLDQRGQSERVRKNLTPVMSSQIKINHEIQDSNQIL